MIWLLGNLDPPNTAPHALESWDSQSFYPLPFLLKPLLSSIFGFFCFSSATFFSSSSSGQHHWLYHSVALCIRCLVYFISILYLSIVLTNTNTYCSSSFLHFVALMKPISRTEFSFIGLIHRPEYLFPFTLPLLTLKQKCAMDHNLAQDCSTSKQDLCLNNAV